MSKYFVTVRTCDSLPRGPLRGPRLAPAAHARAAAAAEPAGRGEEPIEKWSIHFPGDGHATGRRAPLAGGTKAAPQTSFDRKLGIGIVHPHEAFLAPHLEMRLLEGRRGHLRHRAADFRRAGERHDTNLIAD